MQILTPARTRPKYFDHDTKLLDRKMSATSVWLGAAVALVAGMLAGIFTMTE